MTRRSERPHTPRHINIFDDDWEFLLTFYGPGSASRMGASNAVRTIISHHVARIRAKIEEDADAAAGGAPESTTNGVPIL
jgi:hypothetical protein